MSTSPSTDSEPMETVTLKVAEIVPYWRNPRRISDEAVTAVMDSIREYGYQQPIVVDTEKVIIMGHTRYSALRRLGVQEVPVLVARNLTAKQVKELRTIDNRTSEYTRWDFEKLVGELGELDQQLMYSFFPEVITLPDEDVEEGDAIVENTVEMFTKPAEVPTVEFICPACFHGWEMPVSKEDIFSGELRVKS